MEKAIAIISTIITAILFFTGYAFLDGYFNYFDVDVPELEYGCSTILAHAYPAIKFAFAAFESPNLFEVAAIAALLVTYIALCYRDVRGLFRRLIPLANAQNTLALSSVATIALLIFISMNANGYGAHSAESLGRDLPSVAIESAFAEGQIAKSIERLKKKGRRIRILHLVSTSSTHIIVVRILDNDTRWTIRVPVESAPEFRAFRL